MPNTQPEAADNREQKSKAVVTAIEKAKAKNARLRLMKERNENYLAEQKNDEAAEEELTKELTVR